MMHISKFRSLLLVGLLLSATLIVSGVTSAARNSDSETSSAPVAASTQGEPEAGRIQMALSHPPIPGVMNISCSEGLSSLPHSNTYRKSDWELAFITNGLNASNAPWEMFDINGDGLVDAVYAYAWVSQTNGGDPYGTINQEVYYACVYLNTGSGFEPVHRCQASLSIDPDANGDDVTNDPRVISQDYWGDCAG